MSLSGRCPRCGGDTEADAVDNGVGLQRVSAYRCLQGPPVCGWVEQHDELNELLDVDTGAPSGDELFGEDNPWEASPTGAPDTCKASA